MERGSLIPPILLLDLFLCHTSVVFSPVEALQNSVKTSNTKIDIKPIFTTDTAVRDNILENLLQDFEIQKAFLFNVAKCGIFGNWRRIAHFDTSKGDLCPSGLRTVANATTNQTACGRTVDNECTSLSFTSG